MKTAVAIYVFASTLVAGCGSEDPGPEPVTTGAYHHYVTSELHVATDAAQQRAYALDLDGDEAGKPDNQLSNVFVALAGNSDADLQGRVDTALAAGQLVLLHSVRADDLAADPSVSWRVLRGADAATPPRFDGTDALVVDAAAAAAEPVLGGTAGGGFAATPAGAGRFTVALAVSETDPPIALDLIAARVEARVDAAGCNGVLGGAVTQEDVDTVLIPTVVGMMNGAVARDPGCPAACMPGTTAALIVEVFDANKDGVITEEELRGNAIIQSLLAPDLDLLEGDGVPESISLGVGFACVGATFDAGEAP